MELTNTEQPLTTTTTSLIQDISRYPVLCSILPMMLEVEEHKRVDFLQLLNFLRGLERTYVLRSEAVERTIPADSGSPIPVDSDSSPRDEEDNQATNERRPNYQAFAPVQSEVRNPLSSSKSGQQRLEEVKSPPAGDLPPAQCAPAVFPHSTDPAVMQQPGQSVSYCENCKIGFIDELKIQKYCSISCGPRVSTSKEPENKFCAKCKTRLVCRPFSIDKDLQEHARTMGPFCSPECLKESKNAQKEPAS